MEDWMYARLIRAGSRWSERLIYDGPVISLSGITSKIEFSESGVEDCSFNVYWLEGTKTGVQISIGFYSYGELEANQKRNSSYREIPING
ncbi:hypothetical protein GF386_03260 [Candidatus Pacearchaeota archaeon]|nr:hypothetical protein [Candidatus Pacearchaeota archaeon]MBD3283158.1 hypothetical protein [Candidatus Pacearchaeota archaeon]